VDDPGDRFGGSSEPERRSAAERLEERDRSHPEPEARRPDVPRPASRYAWVVGIAFFVVIVIAAVNSLPNEGKAIRGPRAGARMPQFSAPLATSDLEGDANVCQRAPCSKNAGPVPACQVRSRAVLNVCELWRRPVVLTFVFERGADCFPQVDRVERMMRSVRGVNFAVVFFSRKERTEVRAIVTRRGWTMPVAVDQDSAVVNLYRVGGCPTTVFAYAGGRVRSTRLGFLTEDELRSGARRLFGG
jgi:hypothetical protein